MIDKPHPPIESCASELERQTQIVREVMAHRREALRQVAVAEAIMDEDRDLLAQLSKS